MRLIKVEDGLLEKDNYFINTPIGDFLGDFLCSRTNGNFTLKSGYVERNFNYDEYVITVEKDATPLGTNDSFKFYTRKDDKVSGIIEYKNDGNGEQNEPLTHWKLIKYDNFIQGYISNNGKDWVNQGGGNIKESYDIQGFSIDGDKELTIKDYSVYSSPYIRLYNLPSNSKAQLKDELGTVLLERVADIDGMAEIFIDCPLLGSLSVVDSNDNIISQTEIVQLQYGDVFFNTDYHIEIYYKGELIDYSSTRLKTRHELVTIKNASLDETYTDLTLSIAHDTVDTIEISLDNINFSTELVLSQLLPLEEKDLYIKITKNNNYPSYGTRKFALEIDGY